MTQAEMYDKAKKAKALSQVKTVRWEPTEKGDVFVGLLTDYERKHSTRFNADFALYTFSTDNGPVTWIPGNATDALFGKAFEIGQLYAITYQGTEDVGKGNPMNVYTVDRIPLAIDI